MLSLLCSRTLSQLPPLDNRACERYNENLQKETDSGDEEIDFQQVAGYEDCQKEKAFKNTQGNLPGSVDLSAVDLLG